MATDLSPKFSAFLAEFVDPAPADRLAHRLAQQACAPGLLTLLYELRDRSRKVTAGAVESLSDLLELLDEQDAFRWLDLAVALSDRSGATALKYCQSSVAVIDGLSPESRGAALGMALNLAEQDGPMAWEALRHAGQIIAAGGLKALAQWSQIGADLAKWDYVLGSEYFRGSPEAMHVLALDDLKTWAAVSLKLVSTNSLGKPDYMAALTYFRTSPSLLGELDSPALRRSMVRLANVLAERDAARAIQLLGETPAWLRTIQSASWQERVLQYGMLVGEKDPEIAITYLRQAPEVVELVGANDPEGSPASVERFQAWFKGGMEVLEYSVEAARAYFSAESRTALEAIELAASGVALRDLGRVLKLFAEGLSGKRLTIQPHTDVNVSTASSCKAVSGEYVIYLPVRVRRYPTREENLRLYKIMTAHAAGHVEYGSYDLDISRLADLAAQACLRYGASPSPELRVLQDLFQCYPHPALIRDLWRLAEDARVEASLKAEYPGLRRDLERVVRDELPRRSLTHGMTAKEMVVELLLELSGGVPQEVRVPFALEEVVGRAWALLQTVAQPHASADAVVRAAHRAYVLIEELTAANEQRSSDVIVTTETAHNPPGGEDQGGEYRPAPNFEFRGEMVTERTDIPIAEAPPACAGSGTGEVDPKWRSGSHDGPLTESARSWESLRQRESSPGERQADTPDPAAEAGLEVSQHRQVFLYDEWDVNIQDYRHHWCRVVERVGTEGSERFVDQTKSVYGGIIGLLRRYFEGMRTPAFRRVRRQTDGEEVDIEAAIEGLVDRQAHVSPTENVYIRRDRRERDVAAAFLVDLSGSTGRQVGDGGERIIDVEKEGLVLLAEALEAIGDQYALYGYSGQSRRDVQFVILKDFEERYGPAVWRRLDAVQPLVQNRDGAAIRHAVHRLSAQPARVKLLMLLSDGRPLDDLYQDEYALEDTKAALREARAQGVHVFCITVDREGSHYLARMYGEVAYVIIDRVQALPERMPRIYQMLTR